MVHRTNTEEEGHFGTKPGHYWGVCLTHCLSQAENVIFAANGTVKLCDFGSATTRVITPTDDWSAQQRGVLEDEVMIGGVVIISVVV